ncbi:cysteine dioxygenase [Janibacter alkaliphilus]|uniref:Putative metal-dependent enzyme (Double-stranded beta helix superfamily) n=1 Tax=Janibacter alkaliphilus TaxID=1069963 RepID=A0A852WZQ0_9MICO|nr:cysteine dioxygenase [Janibacter alkaliphilus]NYG35737.1 putative metal-dependent enzyme (double-stranded beta helix superfamily) [Janibacter alkaliphilus]
MSIITDGPTVGVRHFTPVHLLRLANLFARDPELVQQPTTRPDGDPTQRSWAEISRTPHLQIWLLRWPPGASTGWHDHGGSMGAFTVVAGELTERTLTSGLQAQQLPSDEGRAYGGAHTHEVVNLGEDEAVSVHAYSPSLAQMTRYDLVAGRLEVAAVEQREPS